MKDVWHGHSVSVKGFYVCLNSPPSRNPETNEIRMLRN